MRIFIGIFVAVLVCSCAGSPPFQCASSDPEFCEMEIKAHYEIQKLRLEIELAKQCSFIHGADSVICR